ncbi:MAG: Sigma 54 modulation/S30EA ribosomal protein terminus [Pseudonocardiales bacterium]|nr:Sigma 54 modulation/S30EA ribosomal protein terminus [Pseudonocardiales bacterium]
MDWLNHRFLYFIDAADGRGKVLYLRHDGDYGLVVPHA